MLERSFGQRSKKGASYPKLNSYVWQAKIMDFGLARLESAGDLTRTDVVMETVAYMSPELAQGHKVDLRTDIWSFGCLLYEMLAGHSPFQGGHEQAIFQAIIHGEPQPITALRRDIPVDIEKILERCLQKNTSATAIALLAGELGKLDLAFEFLDKAYEDRDSGRSVSVFNVYLPVA